MKKLLIAVVLVMLVFSGCTQEAEIEIETGTRTEIAAKYIADMEANDLKRMREAYVYTPEMQSAMELVESQDEQPIWTGIQAEMREKFGKWVETHGYTEIENNDFITFAYEVEFSEKIAIIKIVFGADDALAGFGFMEKDTSIGSADARYEIAAQYVADMEAKDLERLLGDYNYSPEMKQAMNEALWITIYEDLDSKFGTWVETKGYKEVVQEAYHIVAYEVEFSDRIATINIVFDADNVIAGLNYTE